MVLSSLDVYQIKDLMNDNQISISGLLQLILEVNLRNKMKRNYKQKQLSND